MDIIIFALYDNNYEICPSICYQIINQTTGSKLINLFVESKEINTDLVINTYQEYFSKYDNIQFKKIKDKKSKLLDVVADKIASNCTFVFLHNTKLLKNKFVESLSSYKNNKLRLSKFIEDNNTILIISRDHILEAIKKQATISYIFENQSDIDIASSTEIEQIAITRKNNDNVYYSDNLCVFCRIIEKNNKINDSYIYLNKKNNKIYNISNNIMGNLLMLSNDTIQIEWIFPQSEKVVSTYQKDNESNSFIIVK